MKPGGFKLWATAEFSTCTAPHHLRRDDGEGAAGFDVLEQLHAVAARGVALQVAFERQTLNPDFSLDRL